MNRIIQLLSDVRWATCMFGARRLRRRLLFSQRARFDDELSRINAKFAGLAYPEALYLATPEDFWRARYTAQLTLGD